MHARFLLVAMIPAIMAGVTVHRLLGYGAISSILIGGSVLMIVAELLRVLSYPDA